jgi:hypothetical protein
MSIRHHRRAVRVTGLRLAFVSLVTCLAVSAAAAGALGAPAAAPAKLPCMTTGKGAPWSYKGQKGTVYTVLGVNGGPCTLGLTWLMRLTHRHGYLSSGQPVGWQCIVNPPTGECSGKSGGIFEWTPKLT